MASQSEKDIVHFKGSYECHNFLPSVDCGPISISKAKTQLGFKPTPLVRHFLITKFRKRRFLAQLVSVWTYYKLETTVSMRPSSSRRFLEMLRASVVTAVHDLASF